MVDPQRLLMSPGVNTLTIRRGSDGDHRFVLHERDGGKVADGGGLCHVMPVGELQPSSVDPTDVYNDFSVWRDIMREFSEELLGNPEHDGNSPQLIDHANEQPFKSFEQARAGGHLRLWHHRPVSRAGDPPSKSRRVRLGGGVSGRDTPWRGLRIRHRISDAASDRSAGTWRRSAHRRGSRRRRIRRIVRGPCAYQR